MGISKFVAHSKELRIDSKPYDFSKRLNLYEYFCSSSVGTAGTRKGTC